MSPVEGQSVTTDQFGELVWNGYSWVGSQSVTLAGAQYPVRLVLDGYEEDPADPELGSTMADYRDHQAEIWHRVEAALLDHYCQLRPERLAMAGGDPTGLPQLTDSSGLSQVLTPEAVLICPDHTLGITFSCTWDPSLGVGVRVVDSVVTEVGTQDLVL